MKYCIIDFGSNIEFFHFSRKVIGKCVRNCWIMIYCVLGIIGTRKDTWKVGNPWLFTFIDISLIFSRVQFTFFVRGITLIIIVLILDGTSVDWILKDNGLLSSGLFGPNGSQLEGNWRWYIFLGSV